MKIAYLDGARLRRAMLAACEHARGSRAELNRINVFPVPDGDTGTNLALTVTSVADELRRNTDDHVSAVARAAANAGILGARGNCGMILSHWLIGLAEGLRDHRRARVQDVKAALRNASDHIYRSLDRPVEGTMLTVMRETAEEAESVDSHDFVDLMGHMMARSRDALARTPTLLPQLKKAGVVDAGAMGFVHWLEGMSALIHGVPILAAEEPPSYGDARPIATTDFPSSAGGFRFCTEALVRGPALPPEEAIRASLRGLGDSLIVIRSDQLLKVHLHTDEPETIFGYLRGIGRLESHKAEDMEAQHAAVGRSATGVARRPLSIVTDSACDLPEAVLRAHGIHVVPLSLVYEDRVLRDGIDIDPDTFVERLRAGEHPTTSQPPPAAFLEAYRRAASDGEEILAVLLASALSGTFASGQAAARAFEDAPVHLVDSRGASICQGLLVLRAAELAELGWAHDRITADLARIRDRSGILFTVDTFDRLLASGRVSRGRAWLGGLLDIKPILQLNRAGGAEPRDLVRGANALLPRVLDLITSEIGSARQFRFGVVHVDAPERAEEVRQALLDRFGARDVLVSPATPVIATHIGRGAWGVAFQVEE
ncbi:MAG TPA: DegV family protein [Longimicrobiales bacterium]|nr:DegV family protein [Longimicrobiales bacterium]